MIDGKSSTLLDPIIGFTTFLMGHVGKVQEYPEYANAFCDIETQIGDIYHCCGQPECAVGNVETLTC